MTERSTDSMESDAPRMGSAEATGVAEAPGAGASLLIRLWTLPRAAIDPAQRSWREETSEVALLADLVSACRGRLADGTRPQLLADFADLPSAVTAAKRIQQAMVGFASHQPRSRAVAAIAVFVRGGAGSATEAAREPEGEMAGKLLIAAAAGQILLTAAAYGQITQLLPQTSRAISAVRLGATNGGPGMSAYELVWAEPQTYERLRKLVEGMEWAHATASRLGPQAKRTQEAPQSASDTGTRSATAREAPLFGMQTSAPQRFWQRTWVKLGAGAALLVIATVLLTTKMDRGHYPPTVPNIRPGGPSNTGKQGGPNNIGDDRSPGAGQPTTGSTDTIGAANSGSNREVKKLTGDSTDSTGKSITGSTQDGRKPTNGPMDKAGNSGSAANPDGGKPAIGSVGQAGTNANPPKPLTPGVGKGQVEGWGRKDIPTLLNRAEDERGAGHYDKADYWCDIVLKLDPGNTKGRDERRRIKGSREVDQDSSHSQ